MYGLFDWILTWLGKRIEQDELASSRRFVLYFQSLSFPLLDREKRGTLRYDHQYKRIEEGRCARSRRFFLYFHSRFLFAYSMVTKVAPWTTTSTNFLPNITFWKVKECSLWNSLVDIVPELPASFFGYSKTSRSDLTWPKQNSAGRKR